MSLSSLKLQTDISGSHISVQLHQSKCLTKQMKVEFREPLLTLQMMNKRQALVNINTCEISTIHQTVSFRPRNKRNDTVQEFYWALAISEHR